MVSAQVLEHWRSAGTELAAGRTSSSASVPMALPSARAAARRRKKRTCGGSTTKWVLGEARILRRVFHHQQLGPHHRVRAERRVARELRQLDAVARLNQSRSLSRDR